MVIPMKKLILFLISLAALPCFAAEKVVLRVGYFPNITHAQGIVGSAGSRAGGGWFEERLGRDVEIQWFPFNAGPSAMEAVFAGSIDLSYVGPNPALNAYTRSGGDEVRIMAGAALGGAALLVQADGGITDVKGFKRKSIGTPQFGNTQDIAARGWFKRQGFRVTMTGGDVRIMPASNPDLLSLFARKKLDAAWTVEPWVSRLEKEAGARVFLEQRDTPTTMLVASVKALREKRELVEKFVAAHRELTKWLNENPEAACERVRAGLSAEMRFEISGDLVRSAWKRLHFTDELTIEQMNTIAAEAKEAGFLPRVIPLERLFQKKP